MVSLAGDLTELQQLTAASLEARQLFVDDLAKNEPPIHALLQPLKEDEPLLLRFNKGLALHADKLRGVLALVQFKDVIMMGAQNAAAGACKRWAREAAAAAAVRVGGGRLHGRARRVGGEGVGGAHLFSTSRSFSPSCIRSQRCRPRS